MRFLAILILLSLPGMASAQTAAEAQLALRIQELEQQIRYLTGENERLNYELNQLRQQAGVPAAPEQTGAVTAEPLTAAPDPALGSQPVDLGSISIDANDPLIAPDGDPLLDPIDPALPPTGQAPAAPVDLTVLAGGDPAAPPSPPVEFGAPLDPNASVAAVTPPGENQVAALPPEPTTALSGSARDEYDLAYGFILTGDYALAEESFRSWLAAFPNDPQAADAQFWLGESLYQQAEYREAANAFLAVYNMGGQGTKGPDALLKLGMSLAALGEHSTACATFSEVGRRYPEAGGALMSRVNEEASRAGC